MVKIDKYHKDIKPGNIYIVYTDYEKNNFENFGFDIMLDDKLNVYLIEINASPDWTYSTKVTEKLVKIASDDIMKVVLDLPKENLKPPEERNVDTGRFKQIFSSSSFPNFDGLINK